MGHIDEYFSLFQRYSDNRVNSVNPFRTYHVMCEGTETEIKYLKSINNSKNFNIRNGIKVVVLKRTGDDLGKNALLQMHDQIKNYMKSDKFQDEDIAVLITDFDTYRGDNDLNRDLNIIFNDGIEVFGTAPCIELWLILHIENSFENHIKPNRNEFFVNRKISNKHTFASREASKILGYNPKKFVKPPLIDNVYFAITQAEKIENNIHQFNNSIGTNMHVLLKKLLEDRRFRY